MAKRAATARPAPLTRAAIVDAARSMLQSTDLDGLSLRKLAAVLGVTAPALYAHVEDKEDLLRAVAETGFAELGALFDRVDDDDAIARLRAYGIAYVELALSDPEVFKVMFMFRPGALDVPGVDNQLAAADAAFLRPTETVIAAIESGAIHPDRDPIQTAIILWTASHGVASVMLLGSGGGRVLVPEILQSLAGNMVDVTLAGLTHPPTT